MRRNAFVCLVLFLTLLPGCGGTANVSGTVAYDGKPAEHGKIRFLPLDDKGELDGKGLIVGDDIVKGKYTAKGVPFGKKKVAILVQEADGQIDVVQEQQAEINARE